MAGTYSQIYIQVVFSVKGKQNLINKTWKKDLCSYISGIITVKNHKSIIVNGVSDHIHVFLGLRPSEAISDLVRDIKNNSTNFVNKNGWTPGKFSWQEGYGAFSYSWSQLATVYKYILNQEEHHRKKTFREEYLGFLREFDIDFDDRYLFEWIE
ncbi:MAG: transposase [Bacteroidales bacterium]|nr:transposase [Bacteroidales bacterium]